MSGADPWTWTMVPRPVPPKRRPGLYFCKVIVMAFRDPEARRRYQRQWAAKRRRARGVPVRDNSDAIERVQPWREHDMSRRYWWRLYRWTPAEKDRWRHRERA
jgi:hypothetical protein